MNAFHARRRRFPAREVNTLFDKAFFTQRVSERAGMLYRVASGLLRGEADRQDAVQQALLRAWEKRHTLRNQAAFDSWVIRILITECRNIQRAQSRVLPMAQLPDEGREDPDRWVRDALDTLPERQRLCVLLHYIEGLPTLEVARLLRVPHSTVRGRLSQARAALRLELTDGEKEDVT